MFRIRKIMVSICVHLAALLPCLVLLMSGTEANSGISYHMSIASLENCDSTCKSHGLVCAKTGGFPSGDASSIFASLGIVCKNNTDPSAVNYVYADQPCYMATGEWEGECVGFKNISNIIDCVNANNTDIRRLCPCWDPKAPTSPSTFTKSSSTNEKPGMTTDSQNITASRNYTEATPHSSEGNCDLIKIVPAVIAVVIFFGLAGILWEWRQIRSKRGQNIDRTSGETELNVYDTPVTSANSLGRSKSQENLIYESMNGIAERPGDEDKYGYVRPDGQTKNEESQENAVYEQMV